MAKSVIRLPRLNAKAAIAAALILFLPLIVLIASSSKLQDTRSSAAQSAGDGGGGFPAPRNFMGKQLSCVSNTKAMVELSWDKVPGADGYPYGYLFDYSRGPFVNGTPTWYSDGGIGKIKNGRVHFTQTVDTNIKGNTQYKVYVGVGLKGRDGYWREAGKFSTEYFTVSCGSKQ